MPYDDLISSISSDGTGWSPSAMRSFRRNSTQTHYVRPEDTTVLPNLTNRYVNEGRLPESRRVRTDVINGQAVNILGNKAFTGRGDYFERAGTSWLSQGEAATFRSEGIMLSAVSAVTDTQLNHQSLQEVQLNNGNTLFLDADSGQPSYVKPKEGTRVNIALLAEKAGLKDFNVSALGVFADSEGNAQANAVHLTDEKGTTVTFKVPFDHNGITEVKNNIDGVDTHFSPISKYAIDRTRTTEALNGTVEPAPNGVERLQNLWARIFTPYSEIDKQKQTELEATMRRHFPHYEGELTFEEAQILSNMAYRPIDQQELPDNWRLIEELAVEGTHGFDSYTYVDDSDPNNPRVVVAFRGTETGELFDPASGLLPDIQTDLDLTYGKISPQFYQAYDYVDRVSNHIEGLYPGTGAKLELTGHSLGGAIAQYIGAIKGMQAKTISPAGVEHLLSQFEVKLNPEVTNALITNYAVDKDPVATGLPQVGTTLYAEVSGQQDNGVIAYHNGPIAIETEDGIDGDALNEGVLTEADFSSEEPPRAAQLLNETVSSIRSATSSNQAGLHPNAEKK